MSIYIINPSQILVSSTLVLIFFTTIVFGALIPFVMRHFKEKPDDTDYQSMTTEYDNKMFQSTGTYDYDYLHPNTKLAEIEYETNEQFSELTFIDKVKKLWYTIDNEFIKPYIIHNWPRSKSEHERLALMIKEVFIEFQNERKTLIVREKHME